MPSMRVTKQKTPQTASSMSQNTAVGSGSRPSGGKYKIASSAPQNLQTIRPKNKIGN